MPITESLADKWAGSSCTLNGQLAIIAGRLNKCGLVGQLGGSYEFAEFSWETIDRIMNNDGCFKT